MKHTSWLILASLLAVIFLGFWTLIGINAYRWSNSDKVTFVAFQDLRTQTIVVHKITAPLYVYDGKSRLIAGLKTNNSAIIGYDKAMYLKKESFDGILVMARCTTPQGAMIKGEKVLIDLRQKESYIAIRTQTSGIVMAFIFSDKPW